MRFSTRPACGSASRLSRPTASSRACARRGWRRGARATRCPSPHAGARAQAAGAGLRPLLAAAVGALGSLGVASLPIRGAIAPVARPDPATWSAADDRARPRARAGLAAAFIATPRRAARALAGGRAIDDAVRRDLRDQHHARRSDRHRRAGPIGAFERAMREGVGRDGRHLFPAFPYTSFAQSERGRPAGALCFCHGPARGLRAEPRARASRAPFGFRPLMAAWNTMFHRGEAVRGAARPRRPMESRRLSRRGTRPLLRLPLAPQRARRRTQRRGPSGGRRGRRLVRAAAERRRRPRRSPGMSRPISTICAPAFRPSMARPAARWRRSSRASSRCRTTTFAPWRAISSRSRLSAPRRRGRASRTALEQGREGARVGSRDFSPARASTTAPAPSATSRGRACAMFGVKPSLALSSAHPRRGAGHGSARHSRRRAPGRAARTRRHASLPPSSRRRADRRSRSLSARPLRARTSRRGPGFADASARLRDRILDSGAATGCSLVC